MGCNGVHFVSIFQLRQFRRSGFHIRPSECGQFHKNRADTGSTPTEFVIFTNKKGTVFNSSLSSLNKFFSAFGAGDRNLTLSLRHSHLLPAARAIVIAMVLVFHFLEEKQILSVFFVALVDIPRQGTEDCEDHENVGYCGQQQLHDGYGDQHSQHRACNAYTQNRHIQFICAITAHHKVAKTHTQLV